MNQRPGSMDESFAQSGNDAGAIEPVKMIEINLSLAVKPGYGGILPAEKNITEVLQIRGVKPHIQVNSPARRRVMNAGEPVCCERGWLKNRTNTACSPLHPIRKRT